MAETAEVVIIGGGIMAASLAFSLTQLGVRDVIVVERRTIGAGASGKTGALLRQHYTNVHEATLAHLSLQIFKNWDEIIGGDCGFVPTGSIITVSTRGTDAVNIERMQRVVEMQHRIGIRTEVISADQVFEMQPFTNVDDIDVAVYEPESGYVDAIAATRGMAEAARRGGALVIEGHAVTGILVNGRHVVGVQTTDGPIHADSVVCAAGAWSVPLLEHIGVVVPIKAQRVQVAVLNRPLDMPSEGTMTYVDTAAGFFCRNWGPNRTFAGIGGGEFHDIVDPSRYDERLDPGFEPVVVDYISRRMPAMAKATALYGYAGIYDMTPDTHPIVSNVDSVDGLYLMLGFSGAGFKKGPAVGQCLAEMMVNGSPATLDLSPFRLSRFADDSWKLPWSENEYAFSTDFGHRF